MRFLVDGMLGGLARWLRILGQEVRYDSNITDNELLKMAERGNMTLLTRDEELARRAKGKKLSFLLLVEESEEVQLARIAEAFGIGLDASMSRSRCPECGSGLQEASKTEVVDKVPETNMMMYDKFWKCTGCGKVYWLGSHWKNIRQTLGEAKKMVGSDT